jgi:uncharacterized protein (TIGR00369 family)
MGAVDINFCKAGTSLLELAQTHRGSAVESLGIEFTALGPRALWARMPVDERTVQPYGILHGGASILLAESMGSVASHLLVAPHGGRPVGIEVNGSHLRAARRGFVHGVCRPLRVGQGLHFWHIAVYNEDGEQSCDARLTIKILRAGSRSA